MEGTLTHVNNYKFFNLPTEIKEFIFVYAIIHLCNRYNNEVCRLDDCSQMIMVVCRDWYHVITGIRRRKIMALSIIVSDINRFKWSLTQTNLPIRHNGDVCYLAAKQGKYDVVKYAISQGFKCNRRVLFISPFGGNLELVQDLYKLFMHKDIYNADLGHLLINAIKSGNLDIVKWIFKQTRRYGLNIDEVCVAAQYGHIDILIWHYYMNLGGYASSIATTAILYNQTKVMKWLLNYLYPIFSIDLEDANREMILQRVLVSAYKKSRKCSQKTR